MAGTSASSKSLREKVAVIGSGLIGRSWCMLFASAGYKVSVYDVDPTQASTSLKDIHAQLERIQREGMSRGTLTVHQLMEWITPVSSVSQCVQGAFYIQESVPERLELKQNVWKEIDSHVTGDVILASSTSALLPSLISENLRNRARFIVAHPTNPPFYCPLVELIPAPWTDGDVVPTTRALMEELGQDPIVLKKEVDGFVLNRLQYAMMGEGWRLIRDDVVTVEDLDKAMSSGLGYKYAFAGPFAAAYLNADGFLNYCDRYSNMVIRIQNDQGSPEVMRGQTMERIQRELEDKFCPLAQLMTKRKWRDERLLGLAKLKQEMDARDKQ